MLVAKPTTSVTETEADAIAVGVFEDAPLGEAAAAEIDRATDGRDSPA